MSLFDFFKSKKKEEAEKEKILPVFPAEIYEAGALELKDVIAPSAFEINSNFIKIGNKIAKTIFVYSYPRYLSTEWFSPIINLDQIFNVSIFIHPIDTETVLKQMQKKVAEVQSQISMREEKGLVRDPILDTALMDLENLRDKLRQAQEKLFSVGIYLTIYGDTLQETNQNEAEIRHILSAKLIQTKPALFQQQEGFDSVLPFVTDKLQINNRLNSEPLSSIFPFVSFDLTSDKGILYGVNRHNNSLILFDRFSLENYNSVIFAKAGAGKSILGNEPVLIKKDGQIQLTAIGPLIEKIIRERGAEKIDEEMEGVFNPSLEVYSFNKNLKGEWSKVTVAARKDAPKEFYQFYTKSGRQITTTGDHNMLVFKNGKVEALKSHEVKGGDFVPLPRYILPPQKSLPSLNLLEKLKKSKRIYVKGAANIINKHYAFLKKEKIDANLDQYLYKYRKGRRVPIGYFHEILNCLNLTTDKLAVKDFKIISSSGKGSLPAKFPVTKEFLKIMGYITAEGTVTEKTILISNKDKEVINDLSASLKKIGVLFYLTPSAVVTAEKVFVELVKNLGLKNKSKQKRVPPIVFGIRPEEIASYLSAYFEGDGGVERASVSAVSKSKKLISELAYLLFYFGIIARISKTKKKSQQMIHKKLYWKLSISGQDNLSKFAEKIGFISQKKKKQLVNIINKKGNTNVDVIPGLENIFEELYNLFSFQLYGMPEISAIKQGVYQPSPENLIRIVNKIQNRIKQFKKLKDGIDMLNGLAPMDSIVEEAEQSKEINALGWRVLGSSWPVMKKQEAKIGSKNVLKIINAVNSANYTIPQVKTLIHTGFKEMDIPVKNFNQQLSHALLGRIQSDTNYEMLYQASKIVRERYYEILNKNIPRVEEILEHLIILSGAALFWDPITKIEKFENKKEKYVYDLTVNNEVFLAGYAGMFVHNSYTTKLEILRSLMFGIDVMIIDPEREYEYLAETVDGRYINISLTSKNHINPFDLPIPREDESPSDVLRSHIINLVGLFRLMLGGLTAKEDSILDQAITETYAAHDITSGANFSKITPPILTDLEMILTSTEGGEELAQRLKKYTTGSWAGFLNQPTNVDINKNLIVFSVRDMEDELKPVAMYLITHYIWNAVRLSLKKRLLIIDEAWWMMKTEDGASFLFGLAKRARKYYLGVCTITQDVGDFLNSPYGKAIITNSSIQLLLRQSPAAIDNLQETFNLTDEEKYLLLEADVGEGVFFAGLKHVAIKVLASYTEDQIITSDPAQMLAIKKAKEEYAQTG